MAHESFSEKVKKDAIKLFHNEMSTIIKKGQNAIDSVKRMKEGKGRESDFARSPGKDLQDLENLRRLVKPGSAIDDDILEAQEILFRLVAKPSQQIWMEADRQLTQEIARFYDDPLGYIMFIFPWATDPSIQSVPLREPWKSKYGLGFGPDAWACQFLDELGQEIRKRKFDGRNSVAPIRFSTASGHGIGKSAMVSWLIMFILDTRPYAMGVVTANTSDQLRTKTWAEMAKWHHLSLSSHLWDYVNSRGNMSLSRRGSKEVKQKWRCDALTSRAENSESFQGLHAANSTPFYIFDEASGIEEKIWEARFGGATDGEPMSFDFGNPTRKSGYFYENCVGKSRHRYIVRQIDSRDVHITSKPYIQELCDDWGEDSDLFKVKFRGVFPSVSSVQFIPDHLVLGAMARHMEPDRNDALLIGVDCARFGDNNTVLYPRIGMDARSFPYKSYNRLDTVQIVEKVAEMVGEMAARGKKTNGIFVDGGGLGAGPVDMLRRLNYNPIDVNFGGRATDYRYYNWGDQMWGHLREALQRLALPSDSELRVQLTQREFNIRDNGKINLESKKLMAERGIPSPDVADALALTFAQELGSNLNLVNAVLMGQRMQSVHHFDPLDERY